MSGVVKFGLKDGDNTIGKKAKDNEPGLPLAGVGIARLQCLINYSSEERRCMLVPNQEDFKKYKVMVNGELVEEAIPLKHRDRILIGSHHYFLFVDPMINFEENYEWEDAMKEANKEQMSMFN